MSTQGIKKRECDEPEVGRGLLEGRGREQCRSLGLERGRRPFCRMKGGSCREEGTGGLTGSRDMRCGCSPAFSTARRFHLFSEQLWHKDSSYQLLEGKAEEVLMETSIIIKTFLRIASAPIHLQTRKKGIFHKPQSLQVKLMSLC